MRRRDFIKVIAGSTTAWPLAARAQQPDRMRRIGVLMNLAADDREGQTRLTTFAQSLQELGWTIGRNVQIEYRWGAADIDRYRKYATELVSGIPDILIANGGSTVGPLKQATRSVPIVFINVIDPVGAGFVKSLARPGGNVTGFTSFEYGMSAKWLEVLKEVAPGVKRIAVLRDSTQMSGGAMFGAILAVAPSLRVDVSPIDVHDASEIERSITAFAREPESGLIVTSNPFAIIHRQLIIALAARHRLPAVFANRFFVTDGGLISYGPDPIHQYRRAASYVDRILKGEKPADLPVQAPTKYELAVNLKTAKSLGITVPPTLLARADEVIE